MAPYESQVLRNFDDYLSRRSPNQRVVASWVMEEAMDPHRFVETWAGRLRNPWMVAGRREESGDGIWFARSDHDQFQATAEARRRLEEVAEVPPVEMVTVPGFDTAVFPFTTDIPFLSAWGQPLLLGPGSVLVAHTADEHVPIDELHAAIAHYTAIATTLLERSEADK